MINKKHLTRIFERNNGHVFNPAPGTLVNTAVVENDGDKQFDFFMVSNDNPKSACAQPVHYTVATNTTSMTKAEVQEMIHQ